MRASTDAPSRVARIAGRHGSFVLLGFVCGCWQSEPPPAGDPPSHESPARTEAGTGGAGGGASPSPAMAVDAGPAAADAASESARDAGPAAKPPTDAAPAGQPRVPDASVMPDVCTAPIDVRAHTADGRALVVDVATRSVTIENGPLFDPTLLPQSSPAWIEQPAGCMGANCYDRSSYETAIFGATDTAFTVLSGFAYRLGADGTGGTSLNSNEDMIAMSLWFNDQHGATRVLTAPVVMPNDRIEVQLDMMERWAEYAAAWHVQTAWMVDGSGFWLDDAVGRRMIERGIALGSAIFLVDKGMVPGAGFDPAYADPRDVGAVAAAYPEAKFVVLQSAFEHGIEGPYDEHDPAVQAEYPLDRGVNSLITALRGHGVAPHGNVYAALDGVWAELMTRPVEAAHVIGKLLREVGEENVLWGTQSMWYGGPRPQLEAFRDFQIPVELQERHGYPELTDQRKAKILGLNAARLFCRAP